MPCCPQTVGVEQAMRSTLRMILMTSVLGLGFALAGCADFNVDKLDLESLDVFGLSKKKPLPGDRKDVFPTGVPGVFCCASRKRS